MPDIHHFTPSRPDGVVCVAYRRAEPLDSMREVCGYPAGHPIHADDAAPVHYGPSAGALPQTACGLDAWRDPDRTDPGDYAHTNTDTAKVTCEDCTVLLRHDAVVIKVAPPNADARRALVELRSIVSNPIANCTSSHVRDLLDIIERAL